MRWWGQQALHHGPESAFVVWQGLCGIRAGFIQGSSPVGRGPSAGSGGGPCTRVLNQHLSCCRA